jgi:hypothetical protein
MSKIFEKPLLGGSIGVEFSIGGLYELKEYHLAMERNILESGKLRLASIERQSSELPITQRNQFKEFYMPLRWLHSFPYQLRATVIGSGMSFLESQLRQISLDIQYTSGKTFKKDSKTNILESYRIFFKSHGGLAIQTSKEWDNLNSFYDLRNLLVHNGMNLYCPDNKFINRLEKIRNNIPGILLNADHTHLIDAGLCEQMFNTIENLLKHLRIEIAEKWET